MKATQNSVEEVDVRRNQSNKENLQTHQKASHLKSCNITPSRSSPLKSCDSMDGIFDNRHGRSRNFSTSSTISLHSESNRRPQARNSLCHSYLDTSNIRNSPGRFDRDAVKESYSSLSRKDSGYDSSSISGGRNGRESPSISIRGIRNECISPAPVRRSRYESCFDERNSYTGNRRSSCGFESSTDDDFSHNGSFQRLLNDDNLPSRRSGHFRLDTLRDSDESMSDRSISRPLSRSSSNGRMNEILQKFETLSQEISQPMRRSDSLGRFENRPISPSISMENLRQKFSCEDLSPRSDIFSQDNSRHYLGRSSRIY
ncbi:hypothetical protein LOTGIDRAFT_173071 [Lottia gigantea]|uniref:Uncharacterized protein n=1 Tax=Lottia gigantea TaxID=225164 RepID=V4AU15_LOTGI|nr:hypothetical protein LOTGIDRAFT_173071 [Lottia gigantea]ESP00798.1 hypothetical protein LOTGIDRAFT_173071 [Lottia gigantea]